MSSRFRLISDSSEQPFATLDISQTSANAVIALSIATKMQFLERDGTLLHEYQIPSDRDIQNCGGYIDKLLKYRSPTVRKAIEQLFNPGGLDAVSKIPVLKGRSLIVDIVLTKLIERLLTSQPRGSKASLLDHGCTVAEHYDMLDLMLSAYCGRSAAESLSYVGLDISPLALSGARLFHSNVEPEDFRLILAEGSDLELNDSCIDFIMSIGVINHVRSPLKTLDILLRSVRTALVLVIWVTREDEGFWLFNHSGVANYFFSVRDLAEFANKYLYKGQFYFTDFTPERNSTQPSSYMGITDERLDSLGSYTLIFTNNQFVLDEMSPIYF